MEQNNFLNSLLSDGLLTYEMYQASVEYERVNPGKSLVIYLQEHKFLTFTEIADALNGLYRINSCELTELEIDAASLKLLDHSVIVKYRILPLSLDGDVLKIAMADPFMLETIDDIRALTGKKVDAIFSRKDDIDYFINKHYVTGQISEIESKFMTCDSGNENVYEINDAQKNEIQNAPTVRIADAIIETAVINNASDIHIEPFDKILRIRYRIDGSLQDLDNVNIALHASLLSRLKYMANLDYTERRIPQDGHFTVKYKNSIIDFRLSTMPTAYGEKAVIRLLYGRDGLMNKDELGFLPDDLPRISDLFQRTRGAILMTGPTGCGKTTTLYAFLQELNRPEVNIVTIEDPVENVLFGITQVSVNHRTGLTFAGALRSILRQDPDIIMLGEIRDAETAATAIQAATTGHLVLATLHTNDAPSAVIRLIDMGIEPYRITAALAGVVSQRLVRRICPRCKKEYAAGFREAAALNIPEGTVLHRGEGCSVCNYTGYRGRLVVYEYYEADENFKDMISTNGTNISRNMLTRYLTGKGMKTIWDVSVRNVLKGLTTTEEILKIRD